MAVLKSHKVKVRERFWVRRSESEEYRQHAAINPSSEKHGCEVCSRMTICQQTTQSDIILFTDLGGVGRRGGIKRQEGKFFAYGEERDCREISFPLLYLSPG